MSGTSWKASAARLTQLHKSKAPKLGFGWRWMTDGVNGIRGGPACRSSIPRRSPPRPAAKCTGKRPDSFGARPGDIGGGCGRRPRRTLHPIGTAAVTWSPWDDAHTAGYTDRAARRCKPGEYLCRLFFSR